MFVLQILCRSLLSGSAGALLVCCQLANAAPAALDKHFNYAVKSSDCPGDVSQHTLVQCMQKEDAAYDKKVDDKLVSAVASVDSADLSSQDKENIKRQLVAIQQAYETYRKLDCEARVTFLDNSDSGVLEYWDCMRRHALQRLLDLDLFLNN